METDFCYALISIGFRCVWFWTFLLMQAKHESFCFILLAVFTMFLYLLRIQVLRIPKTHKSNALNYTKCGMNCDCMQCSGGKAYAIHIQQILFEPTLKHFTALLYSLCSISLPFYSTTPNTRTIIDRFYQLNCAQCIIPGKTVISLKIVWMKSEFVWMNHKNVRVKRLHGLWMNRW